MGFQLGLAGLTGRRAAIGCAIILAGLTIPRLFHLAGPIDEPHAWRQCDTANFAEDFYRRGFDLLHPAVNWMGAHRTVALEFPLPEALMAAFYHAAGFGEDRARILSLVFFTAGAWYLFLLIRRLCDPWTALWSAGAYGVLPIAWFYSRAVLIDIQVLFLAYAWAYHGLRAAEEKSIPHLILGTAALTLGALVKAPLMLPVGLPLVAAVVVADRRHLLRNAIIGALALVPCLLWRLYSEQLNQTMPDWSFIPSYFRFSGSQLSGFYLGSFLFHRLPGAWTVLGQRFWSEVLTPLGLMLFVFGLGALGFVRETRPSLSAVRFFLLWLVGGAIFVLWLFPLNVLHNYYQLSLLAPAALGMGLGLETIRRSAPGWGAAAAGLLFLGLAWGGWTYAEAHYYRPLPELLAAGTALQSRVPAGSLLIASQEWTDCRDPRLLHYARLEGWSVPLPALSPKILGALRQEGAGYLAILAQTSPADKPFLPPVEQEVVLSAAPWKVWLYRLDGWPAAAGKEKD